MSAPSICVRPCSRHVIYETLLSADKLSGPGFQLLLHMWVTRQSGPGQASMALASGIDHRNNVHEHNQRHEHSFLGSWGNYAPKELKTLTTAERPALRM